MKRTRFVQDLRELLLFATGLWGAISLISILLPVVNALSGTIPLRPQVALLGTILAVAMAFFALAHSITEKSHILDFEMRRPFYRGEIINPRRDMLHNAVSRLVWGMVSLIAYIALNALYEVVGQNGAQISQWLIPVLEPVLAVLYAVTFALVTGAFGALAVIQHARPRSAEAGRGSVNLGIQDETRPLTPDQSLVRSSDGVEETESQQ